MKEVIINNQKYYFYLSVSFSDTQKKYHYISLDTSIKIGDFVAVEVNGEIKEAEVIDTAFYNVNNPPLSS